jgi:hypothetical protein
MRLVTGARQTGKSGLAEHLVPGARHYASLDDLDVLDLARRDPDRLSGGERPITFGERHAGALHRDVGAGPRAMPVGMAAGPTERAYMAENLREVLVVDHYLSLAASVQ